MNQVPHSGPTNGRRHRTSSVAPATWRAVFVRPWCLSWELVKCVTYLALPHCSLLDISRYVVGLLLFSESHARQPTGPSEPCILCTVCVCFCQPFIVTSQQLAVQVCSTSPNILAGTAAVPSALWSAKMFLLGTVCGQQCVRMYVLGATLWDQWQRCASVEFNRGRYWRQ
jgi:hypothetical protein